MPFSTTAQSIKVFVKLSKNDTQHKGFICDNQHKWGSTYMTLSINDTQDKGFTFDTQHK
jgi:hypothetical protein